MKKDKRTPRETLEDGLAAMRRNSVSDEQIIEGAAARVLQTLQAEYEKVIPYPGALEVRGAGRLGSCDDFRGLIPAYLSTSLTSSRKLLFEDHIHECVSCRKALEDFQTGKKNQTQVAPASRNWLLKWSAVGVALAAIVLAFQTSAVRHFFSPVDAHAMVQAIEGNVYSVSEQQVRPISAGARVEASQIVRTGNSSRAVLELADGSRIEMDARSEMWLDRARDGVRINLTRGNLIVAAAKQNAGHLYASTKEVRVTVVGTVFELNAAIKGSRVSVIEGEVQIQQGPTHRALLRGQQYSTNPAMTPVSVQQQIAWSRDAAKYLELLRLGQDLESRMSGIEMRHTSSLVPLIPESTVLFASLPNVTQPVAESYGLFKQRLSENQFLADWWQQLQRAPNGERGLDRFVEHLTRVGRYLGPEVVLAVPRSVGQEAPLVLANVTSEDQLAGVLADTDIKVVRTAAELRSLPVPSGPVIFIGEGLLIGSGDSRQILRALMFRAQPGSNTFSSTALYRKLEQEYSDGVGWLVAADLERLIAPGQDAKLERTGISDVQQLVMEQKTGSAGASYRVTLGFKQNRRGMTAWLAEPSPMGALEFVSPNAYGVAGVVTKDPSLMFDDFFGVLAQQEQEKVLEDLRNYQAEHRVDVRRDLVAPLGNEFLIAVDGPVLPSPSWKVVIEINDAGRLQNTIEWSINDMNRQASAGKGRSMTLTSETVDGRTFYSIEGLKIPTGVHYTYWAGYMIIAPSRALLMEAIQNHDTGNSLLHSASFRSQLPADGRDYASGFVYQNVQSMMNGLPVGGVNTPPSLVSLYGEPDRIMMSSKGMVGMNVANWTGITGMLNGSSVFRTK